MTGATGTLGSNIVELLALNPENKVTAPVRSKQSLPYGVETVHLDLNDAVATGGLVEELQPRAIVHCAASGVRPTRQSWFGMIGFNVDSTLRLFEASCKVRDCHFVYISTGLVYAHQGRPLRETDPIGTQHPYGASKAAADLLLQAGAAEFRRNLTILRPFSFTGLHDGGTRLFPALIQAVAEKRPFRMSAGEQVRDFCAVQDIAVAVAAVLKRPKATLIETYNLGSGLELTLRESVENVCGQLGLSPDLRIGEIPYHPFEAMHLVADVRKAVEIPWSPTTNLAYAVWQYARTKYPELQMERPNEKAITCR